MKYQTKPKSIEAIRWNGSVLEETPVPQWIGDALDSVGHPYNTPGAIYRWRNAVWVGTPKGESVANPGDWIIKHENGDLSVMDDNTFNEFYEPYEYLGLPTINS